MFSLSSIFTDVLAGLQDLCVDGILGFITAILASVLPGIFSQT